MASPDTSGYWDKTRTLMWITMAVWVFFGFIVHFFVGALNSVTILGFPLGFYMGAQGAPLIYLAIIWWYARYMNNLDRQYGVREGAVDD